MLNRIREERQARRLSLAELAARCRPPTTAQTIGRLEMGTRTMSLAWLARIAAALDVPPTSLIGSQKAANLAIAAEINPEGAIAPSREISLAATSFDQDAIMARVAIAVGDYRADDLVWCERLEPDRFAEALNRDVLAPRSADRFAFGRLIAREADRLLLLPPAAGSRQMVVTAPPWIAVARRLLRTL